EQRASVWRIGPAQHRPDQAAYPAHRLAETGPDNAAARLVEWLRPEAADHPAIRLAGPGEPRACGPDSGCIRAIADIAAACCRKNRYPARVGRYPDSVVASVAASVHPHNQMTAARPGSPASHWHG